MESQKYIRLLKKGVAHWNRWRIKHPDIVPELTEANFSGANLRGVNLSRARIAGHFEGTIFDDANLYHARLRTDSDFSNTSFRGANLSHLQFDYLYLSMPKTHVFDPWETRLVPADLSDADFRGADLSDANFIFQILTGARFDGATLNRTILNHARLQGTNFYGATLRGTEFIGADLDGADFSKANLTYVALIDVDLERVKGLSSVEHKGPSYVGIDTIYRSKGRIPENFLRGCGIPEGFITDMHSLVDAEGGIQFYSCFISYSSKDDEFVRRLQGRMRDAHLRVWFAPEDVQGGKKLDEQIETAIWVHDKLLVVLSNASLQSEWVMDELRKGFKAERDTGKRKLFPVRLIDYETLERWVCRDSVSRKDLAEEVRQYFIPDFSNWKNHDSFESAFCRLLQDLRTA